MFDEMRRKDRQISEAEAAAIMTAAEYGVLATVGDDGYPYAVPLNFAYESGKIYFHCAKNAGKKLKNIAFNRNVSFCAVGESAVIPESFSTKYKSAVAFGTAAVCPDGKAAARALIAKYSAEFTEKGELYIQKSAASTGFYEIQIEYMTGKSNV